MVKVTAERLQDSQVLLNIEVEPERVSRSVERAVKTLSNRVNIPGFRRGRAPRHIIERYFGKDAIVAEGIEQIVDEAYREAVREAGIQPITRPEIDVPSDYEMGNPLQFRATVAVYPTVELGNYHEIRMAPIEVDVTQTQVNNVVDRLRDQHAEWVPVERAVAMGDRIVANIRGRAGVVPKLYGPGGEALMETEGGETLIDAEHEEFEVGPSLDARTAPGFSERLAGTLPRQTVTFELSLPEDYAKPELAGKNAVFTVHVEEIKEKRLPELNDEFAQMVSDAQTYDELRQQIHDALRAQLTDDARRQYESRLVQSVVERSQIELPPQLVEHEIDHMIEDFFRSLSSSGLKREDYFRLTGRSDEDLRNEMRDEAVRRLRNSLVMEALADAEKVEVTSAEIDVEIDKLVGAAIASGAQPNRARRELNTEQVRQNIANRLRTSKILDRLKEIATSPAPMTGEEAEAVTAEQNVLAETSAEVEDVSVAESEPQPQVAASENAPSPEDAPAVGEAAEK